MEHARTRRLDHYAARWYGALILTAICVLATTSVSSAHEPDESNVGHVVSIGGSITETVYALGMDHHLVAVDTTSLYPASAQELPNVGYMRQLAAEPIIALNPSLVLAVEDAGPPTVLEQLRSAGVRVVMVPDEPTPEGVRQKVTLVAAALGDEASGVDMATKIDEALAELSNRVATLESEPGVLFLLSVGNGAPLAAGRDTSAANIVALAGGRNVVDAFEGYKPISPEAMVAAAPDVILVTERTLGLLGGEDALLARPEIANTPAGQNRRIVVMDGLLLLGFGPRTPEAVRRLAEALHPDVSFAERAD